MNDKFLNKYRIPSARKQDWDYGWNAAYFVTICTQNRAWYFGEIVNGIMKLSNTGVIADLMWNEIKNHTQHIELGAYVVMPNHVHGIVIINKPVEALHATPLQRATNQQMSGISPKSGSLSAIIRSNQSVVTRHANRLGFAMDGKYVFMIISSGTMRNTGGSNIISSPILKTVIRINTVLNTSIKQKSFWI